MIAANPGLASRFPHKFAFDDYSVEELHQIALGMLADAGFSEEDLTVEVKEQALVVSARKREGTEARTYLHRGIATRAFERRFALADNVRVVGATHENGMLHIDLVREVPEALKPRRIAIASGDSVEKDVLDAETVN